MYNKKMILNFVVSCIFILQLLIVPSLGSADNGGKIYVFSYLVLISFVVFFYFYDKISISKVYFLLFLLLPLFLASGLQARNSSGALIAVAILFIYLLFLLMFSHSLANDESLQDRLIDNLLFWGLLFSALGLYEYVSFLLFGPSLTPLIPYLMPVDSSIRIGGPYGQPNLFAVFLSLTIIAFIYRYIQIALDSSVQMSSLVRFIPFVFVSFVFFLTGSRSGILSLSLSIALIVWLVLKMSFNESEWRVKKEIIWLFLGLICAFVLSSLCSFLFVGEGAIRSFGALGLNGDTRYVLWMSAVLIFLDNPWFGIGLDNFGLIQDSYGVLSRDTLGFVPYEAIHNSYWAHNELLQLLSEGGVFVGIIIVFLFFLYIYSFYKTVQEDCNKRSMRVLFSYVFLLPFIIQSMFSWPLRSPPLLILFFSFLSLLFAQLDSKPIYFSASVKKAIISFAVIGCVFLSFLFKEEIRLGNFKHNLERSVHYEESFKEMKSLIPSQYGAYRVLSKTLPFYADKALEAENLPFVKTLIPMYQKLISIEGSHWQWYNLAHLYLKIGDEDQAIFAVKKAIEYQPNSEKAWAFLHYLNILEAVKQTGKPIDMFWPQGKEVNLSDLELIYGRN